MEVPSVEQANEYADMLMEMALAYGPGLALALVTLFVGLWIIGAICRGVNAGFERSGMEVTLRSFLNSMISIGLKVLLVISVASMVGIETTSFIAVLGAAGLAVGLALQGSLANFAGGVLILIFRPYKVGDVINAAGVTGSVNRIEIFSTILTTPDNKTIIVPNGAVSNGAITNFSTQDTRRVDIVFGIGYDDDLKKGKQILADLINADDRILKDPEPQIVISNLGDSAVDITTRSWVNAADYWGVYFDLLENGKLALDENGISIPYPQTDVHLHKVD
ncbi:MAG: mechanosensitive ion channel [Pseudomonadales bacterium]|nr:mechanosensitive ion channel [Pseudomonadales bacterium]MBO6565202.1 mechanosensitive ion channel [Pseudomonadales bacterium]MBO6597685.1 mechanosensitive ion channel [Pseudomonadales bacterium]MBO6658042.1 mechanosensitive ion channel [Pseudomonadales bacterium]MBO6704000.1 mechanosensitive ion channel [Pseudomonadales bacterium]